MPEPVVAPSAPVAPLAPLSTPPGTPSPSPTAPTEWRAPENAPSWARGKSASEILNIADGLVNAFPSPTPPAPSAPTAPTRAPSEFDAIGDDDYITGAQFKDMVRRGAAPAADAMELASSANLSIVRSQYARDFDKYGPEITAKLAQVPRNLWTLDNLSTVVRLVRSDHLDEIAHERATQLAADMAPTIRSGGSPSSSAPVVREHSLESEKIPAAWKQRALSAGITERVVEEFCRANDITPETFYKQFDVPMNRIVEDIGKGSR